MARSYEDSIEFIETCFMSIDEMARIFSKSQSPYKGGQIGIFPSPRAYIEGGGYQIPRPREKLGILPNPRNMKKYEEV